MRIPLQGRFYFEAVNKWTGARRELAPWTDNLILDAGLNRLGSGAPFTHCMVGSGSATPTVTQTSLVTQVASTTAFSPTGLPVGSVDLVNNYAYLRRTWRFPEGSAAGNLSEVGVGWSSTSCFSRALIVDTAGSPTTITVLADEYLDVTYELRVYWPLADGTATVTIDGNSHATVARAAEVGSWGPYLSQYLFADGSNMSGSLIGDGASFVYKDGTPAGLGTISNLPDGTAMSTGSLAANDGGYINNSNQRKYKLTLSPFGTVVSPVTAAVLTTPFGKFKCSYNPAVPKTAFDTLVLKFTLSWARRTLP